MNLWVDASRWFSRCSLRYDVVPDDDKGGVCQVVRILSGHVSATETLCVCVALSPFIG